MPDYGGQILDARTTGYVEAVVERLRAELGEALAGVYLFGSVALDDYRPPRSDLDIAAVAARALSPGQAQRVAARLDHVRLPCPARRLELVIYGRERLAAGDVSFELDLNTGPGLQEWRDDARQAPTHWFVLDVAIGRAHGRTIMGPPPAEVFPDQPRERVVDAVRQSLDWHVEHGGEEGDAEADAADVVLNACRACRFLEEGTWASKTEAGRWALSRAAPAVVVRQALGRREAGEGGPPAAAAREFAAEVRRLTAGQ